MINKCGLFKDNLSLFGSPYRVKSSVSVEIFREFVSALNNDAFEIYITNENFAALSLLCEEFDFHALARRVWALLSYWSSVAALEKRADAQACATAGLQTEVAGLSRTVASLDGWDARLAADLNAHRERQGRIVTLINSLREEISNSKGRGAEKAEVAQLSVQVNAFRGDQTRIQESLQELNRAMNSLRTDVSALKARANQSARVAQVTALQGVQTRMEGNFRPLNVTIDSMHADVSALKAREDQSAKVTQLSVQVNAFRGDQTRVEGPVRQLSGEILNLSEDVRLLVRRPPRHRQAEECHGQRRCQVRPLGSLP
jgi:chromosome segregation ATPase